MSNRSHTSIIRCPSAQCGRPFQINRFGTRFSLQKERAKITCPHCALQLFGDKDSVYLTHALSVEEEAEFEANARKNGEPPIGEAFADIKTAL